MEERNKLMDAVGDLTWNLKKSELKNIYYILAWLTEYADNNPTVEKAQILSVLRNITSNIQMLVHYRCDEDDVTMGGDHTMTNE